jgi:hypothetical protein
MARENGQRSGEAAALHLSGETSALDGSSEVAEGHYREALALAGELGMRPLAARCHHDLGRLYLRTGRRDQARDQLTTATAMYREMDMRLWLEQVDAECCRKLAPSHSNQVMMGQASFDDLIASGKTLRSLGRT